MKLKHALFEQGGDWGSLLGKVVDLVTPPLDASLRPVAPDPHSADGARPSIVATTPPLASVPPVALAVAPILDALLDAALVVRHDSSIEAANRAAGLLVGIPHEQLVGGSLASLFTDHEAFLRALDKTSSRGTVRDVPLEVSRSRGSSRDVELSASMLAVQDGIPSKILVILHDVTEFRRNEANTQKDAAYARTLLDAALDPLFAISPAGKITDVNDATVTKTGIGREQLVGMDFSRLFTDSEAARRGYERTLSDGKVQDYQLTLRHRSGAMSAVSFNASTYRNEEGELVGISAVARDVTLAKKAELERDAKEWVMTGLARLNAVFQEQTNTADLARRTITELVQYVGAQVGALFACDAHDESGSLNLLASHAYTRRKSISNRFAPGEGIIGQAALERKQILLSEVPEDYIRIASGLGEASPRNLCVTPLLFEGTVKGVVEVASFGMLSDTALEYFRQAAPNLAVALEASHARERAALALGKAQQLAAELQAQAAELEAQTAELEAQRNTLRNTNAELEAQAAELEAQQNALRKSNTELQAQQAEIELSEQKLKAQQAELELVNSELNKKNELLERQRSDTEEARKRLAAQAEEVALASKYKSEFLANMSHELRTPLNSLLLLARSLRDNAIGNLTADQVESAGIIFDSGSDLLNLINEILDLSKIEAGKMELRLEQVELADAGRAIVSQFDHMARAQGLTLSVVFGPDVPSSIVSDHQRLGQVIKNLIGNALKFTEKGGVTVQFATPGPNVLLARSGLDPAKSIAIHVIDTGIGIPLDKQRIIFEAFQQADSGDRRRYGGTGLGLSISRELVALLGGEIQLVSEPGRGSTFSVYLPIEVHRTGTAGVDRVAAPTRQGVVPHSFSADLPVRPPGPLASPPHAAPPVATPAPPPPPPSVPAVAANDDRKSIGDNDHIILVIEDDPRFGKILADHIRERSFKCIRASSGEEGLELAREFRPHGVVLDIQLPRMDGWAVLNALKQDVSLRHIPVHIVSVEEPSSQSMRIGAIGQLAKPIGREQIEEVLERLKAASALAPKRVLVVEDDELMRKETVRLIGSTNVTVEEVATGLAAIEALRRQSFHLIVMDLGLPDMQGLELLKHAAAEKLALPPVIIHTVRELTIEEEYMLRHYAESIIVKDVRSQERLIDEVALFLHRVVRDLPEENRRAIQHIRESDEPLRGKTVLTVDDDMRTMFAMARMLASHGIHPIKAENGERALALLDEHPEINLVLLDMMMPVMDGYETARRIRSQPRFANLPVIALTAKAMREDRQKCLDAGATDYLTKPVDPDRLVSLMRVLLCR